MKKKRSFICKKIGVVHYNPFEEKGEKSFILSLLDKDNSGILLNYLYTRDGLRVYFKKITQGKQEKGQLSKEEEEAIKTSSFLNQ